MIARLESAYVCFLCALVVGVIAALAPLVMELFR